MAHPRPANPKIHHFFSLILRAAYPASKLFSAAWNSYPLASNAATAWLRLKPMPQSCFTGSTSSSTAGVTSSGTGERCCDNWDGGAWSAVFFFFPNGKRI